MCARFIFRITSPITEHFKAVERERNSFKMSVLIGLVYAQHGHELMG